jgi:hypothetical protein
MITSNIHVNITSQGLLTSTFVASSIGTLGPAGDPLGGGRGSNNIAPTTAATKRLYRCRRWLLPPNLPLPRSGSASLTLSSRLQSRIIHEVGEIRLKLSAAGLRPVTSMQDPMGEACSHQVVEAPAAPVARTMLASHDTPCLEV